MSKPPPQRIIKEQDISNRDDPTPEIRRGGLVIFLFFGVLLGWAALTPLDAAVVAEGTVVVSGSRQTVQHRDGGTVSRLAVKEGQHVQAGQTLLELASPELVAQKQSLLFRQFDLQIQRARLVAEINGLAAIPQPEEWASLAADDKALAQAALQKDREKSSGRRVSSEVAARIAGYRSQIASLRRQEDLLLEELDSARRLRHAGAASAQQVRSLEAILAELQGRIASLDAETATAQEQRSQRLREIDASLDELKPKLEAIRTQIGQMLIRAPVAGNVVGLNVHTVGGVVRPGDALLDIVPEGQDLVVEARIRPEDADDLTPGMQTELRITAFEGRDLPTFEGVVVHVSADRFEDQRTGQGYFVSRVSLPTQEVQELGRRTGGRTLRVGLPVQIVVPIRKRTLLDYILEPLNQSLWRALREA